MHRLVVYICYPFQYIMPALSGVWECSVYNSPGHIYLQHPTTCVQPIRTKALESTQNIVLNPFPTSAVFNLPMALTWTKLNTAV